MTLCGDMAACEDVGYCMDTVAFYRHSLPRRFIARKAALMPRNLARLRAEYARQSPFHAQKYAGTCFALGKHRIRFENLKGLGDKRARDGAPTHDRRNGLQNHEAAATRRADQQRPPRRGRAFVAERLPRAGQGARKGWSDTALCRRVRFSENLQHGDAASRGYPRKPPRIRFRA